MKIGFRISSSDVAERTGITLIGRQTEIDSVVTLKNLSNESLLFLKRMDEGKLEILAELSHCIMVLPKEASEHKLFVILKSKNTVLLSDNPRLDFARILGIVAEDMEQQLAGKTYHSQKGATIGQGVKIGKGTVVKPGAFVDHGATIGDDCVIKSGARICSRVRISDRVVIGESSVIGGQGFAIEKDESDKNYRIPHIGGVVIFSDVGIGSLNTVVSGTIEPTIVEEHVKTDDHVHIAHNCRIGKNTSITACVEISGSVLIGEDCMIGPNSTLINGITIGSNVTIGIGSVVTKSLGNGLVVTGNPADLLENKIIAKRKEREALKSYIEKHLGERDL